MRIKLMLMTQLWAHCHLPLPGLTGFLPLSEVFLDDFSNVTL